MPDAGSMEALGGRPPFTGSSLHFPRPHSPVPGPAVLFCPVCFLLGARRPTDQTFHSLSRFLRRILPEPQLSGKASVVFFTDVCEAFKITY